MGAPPEDIQSQIDAAVRRYISRLARRYAPVVAGVIAFVLIVVLVPSVNERTTPTGSTPFAAGQAGPGIQPLPGQIAAPGSGAAAQSSVPLASGVQAAGPGTSFTAPPAAGGANVARSGVRCGPGVRQVTWTIYAPPCVPAYRGANGGATSHGVTKSTITVSYRMVNSTEDTAVYTAAGDAAPGKDPDYLADMRAYIDLFNRTYELYGRKVVLKEFQGQGDYIAEDQGQAKDRAAADAATARDTVGAFADVTLNVKGSEPFWTSLAKEKVVAIGPLGFPQSYYENYYPYWWSTAITGTKLGRLWVNAICQRMAGLKAIFAGDESIKARTRVFGLITPENPEYMAIGDEIQSGLAGCGVPIKHRENYTINVATFQGESINMIAQMKNNDVTTIICYCDPLIPIFLSRAADQQQYVPEWFEPYWRDQQGRLMTENQWRHALSNGIDFPPRAKSEAYRVFKMVEPKTEPREQYFDVAYVTMVYLFAGLQSAGPNLTPETFARGLFSLPESPRGDYGVAGGGIGNYSPTIESQITWWDPDAKSGYDGKPGAWKACEGGKWYRFSDGPSAYGSRRTQLHCFGR